MKTKAEIVFELVKSLNSGNSGDCNERVPIAIHQYERLVRNGIIMELDAEVETMRGASGIYLNYYNEDLDIFVILNEANDTPNQEEVSNIEKDILKVISEGHDSLDDLRDNIIRLLGCANYNCLSFGFQVKVGEFRWDLK